jgi:hypothetical protein
MKGYTQASWGTINLALQNFPPNPTLFILPQ